MKVRMVLHKQYGGFSLSEAAKLELGITDYKSARDIDRTDPELIRVVEKLGNKAGDGLEIVTVNIELEIEDHDGFERVYVHGHEA
jgi:hypothetical protein